jgi:hypothetical protein
MEGITLNTVPTWIPGLIMIYTGIIWLITRKLQIRMDSRIIAFTLLAWGSLYLLGSLSPDSVVSQQELIFRVMMSRIVVCFICVAQSLPMTISYIRTLKRGQNGK